jgi:L-aminopeptidase/D-esterase-like protein
MGQGERSSMIELCRARTSDAVGVLIKLMHHKGPHQFAAAVAILDRAWGKPTQHIETTGNSTLELHLIAARAVSQAMLDGVIEAEIMDDKSTPETRDLNTQPSE